MTETEEVFSIVGVVLVAVAAVAILAMAVRFAAAVGNGYVSCSGRPIVHSQKYGDVCSPDKKIESTP